LQIEHFFGMKIQAAQHCIDPPENHRPEVFFIFANHLCLSNEWVAFEACFWVSILVQRRKAMLNLDSTPSQAMQCVRSGGLLVPSK
jgi:hypothetical protein